MPTNIEVKARVRDAQALRARAARLADAPEEIIPQLDTFFPTARGRLKLREFGSDTAQLVFYERRDLPGPKRSEYHIFETRHPEGLKDALTLALGVRGTVKKVRHLYLIGQTRLHLDEVEGLGDFMELEVVLRSGQSEEEASQVADALMGQLGIEKEDLVPGAYVDLKETIAPPDQAQGEQQTRVIGINHVAFVIDSMDRSLAFWREALGIQVRELRDVPAENSQVAFLPVAGSELELVLPTTEGSGIAKYLAKRGPGMHHICLEVDDLESVLVRLKGNGVRLIEDRPRVGGHGVKYAFVHPESTSGVLVELYEGHHASARLEKSPDG